MNLVLSLIVTIAAFSALWAIHLPLRNAGVVDFYWGAGFVVIGGLYALRNGVASPYQMLFLAIIVIWAIRLSYYLVKRFAAHTSEDPRYTVMRKSGGQSFWWTSLPKIFVLQAVVMWIIATPVHTGLAPVSTDIDAGPLLLIGLVLFCIGLVIETIADHQLARFKAENPGSTQLLRSGLWGWSRHPNYFGEAVLWWGLGLYALALSGSLVSLLGPLVLTILLVGVTGRMTDQHLQDSRGTTFSQYKRETSGFLPLPNSLYEQISKKNRPVN